MTPRRGDVLRLAGAVPCDPRTAAAWLRGGRVQGLALRERLEAEAVRLGLVPMTAAEIAEAARGVVEAIDAKAASR